MAFKKPNLLYSYDALEPHIDEETMKLHHQKHHSAYVAGLDGLSGSVPSDACLHSLLGGMFSNGGISEGDKDVLARFGGGHYNHSLFWEYMSPKSDEGSMSPLLVARIKSDFGSFDKFKEEFKAKSAKVFGSGWCWWVFNTKQSKSFITTTKDQLNPIMEDGDNVCLLGLDVWEHAYYVKYRNERVKYIDSWWNVVNWELVSQIHDEIALNGKQLEISEDGYIVFN
ncbi:superoxide dismutase, Fe-Mn family [Pancytospora epiphaga]|nr:superoxide dismutase, Fe-Mn family [Pancytospora epiphaga]